MQYVIFLRAVNVGGRTVKKETLQEAFSSLGFKNVATHRQSGNITFSADETNPDTVKAKVEAKLKTALGYDVAAFVRTFSQLKQLLDFAPFPAKAKPGMDFMITFLEKAPDKAPFEVPVIVPKSTAQITAIRRTEVFSETHGGGEGGMPNPYLESKLKTKATTRNLNVVKEIVEKFREH